MARTNATEGTVANSREVRDKAVAHLSTLSSKGLMQELVTWTVRAQELSEASSDLRRERGEARGMLELLAAELRGRQAHVAPAESAA